MDLAIVLVPPARRRGWAFPSCGPTSYGQPLLAHAMAAALAAGPAELIVVVTERSPGGRPSRSAPERHLVRGGARRRDSVAAGLAASTATWLAIHDAARALAPAELFQRGLDAAQATGAAIPAVPLKDTIKRVADVARREHAGSRRARRGPDPASLPPRPPRRAPWR